MSKLFPKTYDSHIPILWRLFQRFAAIQSAPGLLLILGTLMALAQAKLGILGASLLARVTGYFLLRTI